MLFLPQLPSTHQPPSGAYPFPHQGTVRAGLHQMRLRANLEVGSQVPCLWDKVKGMANKWTLGAVGLAAAVFCPLPLLAAAASGAGLIWMTSKKAESEPLLSAPDWVCRGVHQINNNILFAIPLAVAGGMLLSTAAGAAALLGLSGAHCLARRLPNPWFGQ
jgi:hypothetical protein